MAIWPAVSGAQRRIGTVSAQASTAWVLIRRRNYSFRRSIAFLVRAAFHFDEPRRVKVRRRSPASSRLSETARHFRRHMRTKALRAFLPRLRWRQGSCRNSRSPDPRAYVSGDGPAGCDACERCNAGSAGRCTPQRHQCRLGPPLVQCRLGDPFLLRQLPYGHVSRRQHSLQHGRLAFR